MKAIPFLLLLIAVIILLYIGGTDTTDLLTSMIAGAIAVPTAIWAIHVPLS
ncbi:hypothetical protein ACW2QC_14390 [Virgibacillus sp. FSP13]